MSKDENRKNKGNKENDERQNLVESSKNNNEENDNKNNEEQIIDKIAEEEMQKNELLENAESSDEKVEEQIKEKYSNERINDMSGSAVKIVPTWETKPKNLGLTRTLLLATFATMIGTSAQFGYALGVMNAPSEVKIDDFKQQHLCYYFFFL